MDLTCLYSTVKNISGGTLKFGFLPPHGRSLADDGEFTVFGNILDAVANGFDRATSRRSVLAFENAIDDGKLEIVNTPAPILKDATLADGFMIVLDNGTLGVDDPCWESTA
tara:strand:- start:5534 stop:5866 length:333 start_codon:yes stop_codon:yes gene_type:complete